MYDIGKLGGPVEVGVRLDGGERTYTKGEFRFLMCFVIGKFGCVGKYCGLVGDFGINPILLKLL